MSLGAQASRLLLSARAQRSLLADGYLTWLALRLRVEDVA